MRYFMLSIALVACNGSGTLGVEDSDTGVSADDSDVPDTEDTEETDTEDTEDTEDLDPVEEALGGECNPRTPNGRLDLVAGCANGACVGMTYDRMVEALGEGTCQAYDYYPGFVGCWWESGISTTFEDADGDEIPDDNRWQDGFYVFEPFDGATEEGLGLGIEMACYFEILGAPDSVDFVSTEDGFLPHQMLYEDLGLYVFDEYTRTDYGQDGYVDYLYVTGSPEG